VPRRSAVPTAALVAGLLAALATGCSSAPPEVTFAAGAATVQAGPTQYCELDLSECAEPGAPVELAVPAGTPVRITVPDEVAETPWHVVFSYRDDAGQQVDERSRLFPPDAGRDYTVAAAHPVGRADRGPGAAVRAGPGDRPGDRGDPVPDPGQLGAPHSCVSFMPIGMKLAHDPGQPSRSRATVRTVSAASLAVLRSG
jgi:hypothetical protein